MALNAREVPPLPLGGNSSLVLVQIQEDEDIPFDDEQTSIAGSSDRSVDLAILEAQMQLETNLIEVAEAKARQAATRMALLKAGRASSSSSDTRSRGSRVPRIRVPPDAQPAERRMPPPRALEQTLDELEADLSTVIDACRAEVELGRNSLTAELLAQHQAEARLRAGEAAQLSALANEEHAALLQLHAEANTEATVAMQRARIVSEQQSAMVVMQARLDTLEQERALELLRRDESLVLRESTRRAERSAAEERHLEIVRMEKEATALRVETAMEARMRETTESLGVVTSEQHAHAFAFYESEMLAAEAIMHARDLALAQAAQTAAGTAL